LTVKVKNYIRANLYNPYDPRSIISNFACTHNLNNSCTPKLVLNLRRELRLRRAQSSRRTLAEVTQRNAKAFGKDLIMLNLATFLLKLYAKLNFLLKNQQIKHLCALAVNISG
jgi:hypothetical protein